MKHFPFRLNPSLRWLVYGTFGLLLLTGATWMLLQPRIEDEAWATWQKIPRLLLTVHGGAAMLALLVLGALTSHVIRGWRAGKNHWSGGFLVVVNGFLILTGYGLYYAGDETFRDWLSRWHAWIGLGLFVLLPAHVLLGRWIVGWGNTKERLPQRSD